MSRSIFRKPSLKKSFKARTTGRMKREIKRALIPGYGKKGMGLITNPKRSLYNSVYHRTSIDTLKRVHHQGGNIVLTGDNASFPPIILNEQYPGRIIGKAIRVSFDL